MDVRQNRLSTPVADLMAADLMAADLTAADLTAPDQTAAGAGGGRAPALAHRDGLPAGVLEPHEALPLLRADPEMFAAHTGAPLLLVHARGPLAIEVAALARWLPCVLVAVAPDLSEVPPGIGSAGYDVLLTGQASPPAPWVGPLRPAHPARPELPASPLPAGQAGGPGGTLADMVDALAAMTRLAPFAAVALTQLLRYSAGVDVRDAVVAESFTYSTLQAGPEFATWLAGHRAERERRAAARAEAGSAAARPATTTPAPSEATPVPLRDPAVLVERIGDELWVVLNRPRVHNAVSRDLRDGLVAAFGLAADDPTVTAVRLRGAGRSFCSGGDLTEFGTLPDPSRAHAVRTTRSIPLALLRCVDRVTAYVHGTCVGAGVEVPAFAPRVIADPATTFRLPELAMGLVPGAGGTSSIVRRVGRERAAFLALSGWALGTHVALDWGLVDEVRPIGGEARPAR